MTITGTDERGPYEGQLELRGPDAIAADKSVITNRVIRYPNAPVENGKEPWWVWTGTAVPSGAGFMTTSHLLRADFVHSRGGITRSDADKVPLAVTGVIDVPTSGTSTAHFTGGGLTLNDSMTARQDLGAQPIFALDPVAHPVNTAPTGSTKTSPDTLYASDRALPSVAPCATDPAFVAGVADVIVDKTDFGETLGRASAYSQTLAQKAAIFDAETPSTFVDSLSGQLADSVISGVIDPSGDGALWTSCYVASQAYRYLVTGDGGALTNLVKSVTGMQVLLEIVPDQTTFARTLRPASGNATGKWHAGTGVFAAYDWLEGGNNDMFKGSSTPRSRATWRCAIRRSRARRPSVRGCARTRATYKTSPSPAAPPTATTSWSPGSPAT